MIRGLARHGIAVVSGSPAHAQVRATWSWYDLATQRYDSVLAAAGMAAAAAGDNSKWCFRKPTSRSGTATALRPIQAGPLTQSRGQLTEQRVLGRLGGSTFLPRRAHLSRSSGMFPRDGTSARLTATNDRANKKLGEVLKSGERSSTCNGAI